MATKDRHTNKIPYQSKMNVVHKTSKNEFLDVTNQATELYATLYIA